MSIEEHDYTLALARLLAHTITYEARQQWLPVQDAVGGGDPPAPNAIESTDATMAAYLKNLPAFLSQMVPSAQAQLAASQATGLPMSQLQADIYAQTAPQLNQVSQQMDASNKYAGAQGDLAVLQGPGAASARAVQDLSRQFDPEFYSTRSQTANTIGGLMNGGLSPSEEEAINRSLARQNFSMGLLGTPTATSTVANAMTFGDAARQRQLQGVNAATSFLPASRSGFDPTQVALGRPSINTGGSQFLGVDQNAGKAGQDLFNTIGGFQTNAMNINANRRDSLDRVTGVLGSMPSYS